MDKHQPETVALASLAVLSELSQKLVIHVSQFRTNCQSKKEPLIIVNQCAPVKSCLSRLHATICTQAAILVVLSHHTQLHPE